MAARRMKCRYCDYTTLIYFRTQGGEARSGFNRLLEHIRYVHPAEYAELRKQIALMDDKTNCNVNQK